MKVKSIVDNGIELAHVYDLNLAQATEFPTPAHFPMQFGVGVINEPKEFQPHVHKDAERTISATAEFVFIMTGKMHVLFLNKNGDEVERVELGENMCFLQIAGGHAISMDRDTKYFELKQGPYYGRDFDKFDIPIRQSQE